MDVQKSHHLAAVFALFDRRGLETAGSEEMRFPAEYVCPSPAELGGAVNDARFTRWARAGGSNRRLLLEQGCGQVDAQELDGKGCLEDGEAASLKTGSLDNGPGKLELLTSPGAILPAASELQAALELTPCQLRALEHIRNLARKNHERALPEVEARACSLGFREKHVWTALTWIRECAQIIIHVNLDKALDFLESDAFYRSQFETGTSGGLLNARTRESWERDLFGGAYDGCSPFERVKYGVLNVFNDPRGYVRLTNFGDSYLVLRDVRLRCTLSPEDSGQVAGGKRLEPRAAPAAERLAVPDLYAHVLREYSDEELCEALRAANARDVRCGDTGRVVRPRKYKEVQIHGELRLCRHVARLVAHERHWPLQRRLEQLCERHGWTLGWMDMERSHMESSHRPDCRRSSGRWKTQPQ